MSTNLQRDDGPPSGIGERSTMDNARLWGGVALAAALLLFFVQNLDDAEISFLWMDWTMPLVFALLISAAFGALAAWAFGTLRGRAGKAKNDTETPELRK